MSAAFQWSDAYSVKVLALDNQHKQLFQLMNELQVAMGEGQGKEVTADVLDRLIAYTVQHFAAEEKVMEQCKYEGLASHRVEHLALTDRVLAFKKEFVAGSGSVPPQLLTFLQQWLRNHIQSVDQRYSDFLNAQGVH